jgi:hypothetical protein
MVELLTFPENLFNPLMHFTYRTEVDELSSTNLMIGLMIQNPPPIGRGFMH